MSESGVNNTRVSLEAQLYGLVCALNMHVERAEKLAVEVDKIKYELADAPEEIEA